RDTGERAEETDQAAARHGFVVGDEDAQLRPVHAAASGTPGSATSATVRAPSPETRRKARPPYACFRRFSTVGRPSLPSRGPRYGPGFSRRTRISPSAAETRIAIVPRCPAAGPCFTAFSARG